MVGQNVLLELVEGDKVQLYVYTSAGITDHKNSHYTQFIGCLLRPSVDTLATIMRRLGSSEAMDDEVSAADDASLRNGGGKTNGDSSIMGGRSRRGGSKSRVLSPGPPSVQQTPSGEIQYIVFNCVHCTRYLLGCIIHKRCQHVFMSGHQRQNIPPCLKT